MIKVFIDGSSGTTGLRIKDRLRDRKDIELVTLPEGLRKDENARADAINASDVAFFCLPDAEAVKAAEMASGNTVLIDTSTAHRVDPDWTYGFAEINGLRKKIAASKRIANPGCHASGFIALAAPLVHLGLIDKGEKLSCFSLTGYSGGGKKMIGEYEDPEKSRSLLAPRVYGINMNHKHLPEMAAVCGLEQLPLFIPTVSSYYAGMEVTIPLYMDQVNGSIEDVKKAYKEYYSEGLVRYAEACDEGGYLSAEAYAGRDDMEVSVFGSGDRILLVSRFDNLGKGASGAAIQNMNIVLGIDETTGLDIGGR